MDSLETFLNMISHIFNEDPEQAETELELQPINIFITD